MRAERKLGLLLETTDRAKAGDNQWSFDGLTTTLKDLLVASNPTASRWKQVCLKTTLNNTSQAPKIVATISHSLA